MEGGYTLSKQINNILDISVSNQVDDRNGRSNHTLHFIFSTFIIFPLFTMYQKDKEIVQFK